MSRGRARTRAARTAGRRGRTPAVDLGTLGLAVLASKAFLLPLAFDPVALVTFSIPKALLAQATGALLAALVALLVLRHGPLALGPTRLHTAVGVLVLVYGAAAVFAFDHVVALRGAPDRGLGLIALLDGAVTFAAVPLFVRTRAAAFVLGSAAFASATLVLAYALLQFAGADPLAWKDASSRERPFSTLGNPTILGQYAACIGVAAAGIAAQRGLVPSRLRLALSGLAVAAVASALITGTRAVVVGIAATAALAAVLFLVRARPRYRLPVGAVAVTLGVVGVVLLALTPAGQRFEGIIRSADEAGPGVTGDRSVGGRLILYDVALAEIRERPVLGVGPDNYLVRFPAHRPPDSLAALGVFAVETSPHSWVFHVATDAGLLGLATFAVMVLLAIAAALRRAAAPGAVIGAVVLVQFLGTGLFTVNDPGTEWLLWSALGLVATSDRTPQVAAGPSRAPRFADLALSAVALAAIAVTALWYDGARAAGSSATLRGRQDTDAAVLAARTAVARDPMRAEYWGGLGLSYAASRRYAEAERAFQAAVDLSPYHTTWLANLARAQVGRGLAGEPAALERAGRTAERAVANDPHVPDVHYAYALAAWASGRWEIAAAAAERAAALAPPAKGDAFAYELAARSYQELGDQASAERWLRVGVAAQDSVALRVLLARLLIATDRRDEAASLVEEVLRREPANADALRLREQLAD